LRKGKKKQTTKAYKRFKRVLIVKLDMYLRHHSLVNSHNDKMKEADRITLLAQHTNMTISGKPIVWLALIYNSCVVKGFSKMSENSDDATIAKSRAKILKHCQKINDRLIYGMAYEQMCKVIREKGIQIPKVERGESLSVVKIQAFAKFFNSVIANDPKRWLQQYFVLRINPDLTPHGN
jgi:hypothetical protein